MAFVNLSRWLSLNEDEGERMGRQVADQVQPDLNRAQGAIRRAGEGLDDGSADGAVATAQAKLGMLGSGGSIAAMLGGGANALDAALAGKSSAVGTVRNRSGNLSKMLGDARTQYADRMQGQASMFAAQQAQQDRQRQQSAEDAEQDRLLGLYKQQRGERVRGYNPQGASEYAEYSDYIKSGRR